jgi:prepilin-type N-terminal cleavage/methylation domain-containing protein
MPTRRRTGFTIIELVVVMAIIAIIAGGIAGVVIHLGGKARVARTGAEIRLMSMALESYRRDLGAFPPDTGYGLDPAASPGTYDAGSLWRYLCRPVKDPATGRPLGPYLKEWSQEKLAPYTDAQCGPSFYLIDPWGRTYAYVGEAKRVVHNTAGFDIFSTGPDGRTACDARGAAGNMAYDGLDNDANGIVDDADELGPDARHNGTGADDINNWSPGS